jgi:hypothetical protein
MIQNPYYFNYHLKQVKFNPNNTEKYTHSITAEHVQIDYKTM